MFVIVITEKLIMYIGTEIDLILGRRYMVSSEKRCKRGRGRAEEAQKKKTNDS